MAKILMSMLLTACSHERRLPARGCHKQATLSGAQGRSQGQLSRGGHTLATVLRRGQLPLSATQC